jgi:hypothetical protein
MMIAHLPQGRRIDQPDMALHQGSESLFRISNSVLVRQFEIVHIVHLIIDGRKSQNRTNKVQFCLPNLQSWIRPV